MFRQHPLATAAVGQAWGISVRSVVRVPVARRGANPAG
jgi:hypothetical protein